MIRKTVFLLILWISTCLFGQYKPDRDGWNFYNFLMTTDSVQLWKIYSQSFLGVGNTYEAASLDDQLFFDLVIKKYAGKANCFGLSLLSLLCYKEGGHLGACSPVYDYEGDLSNSKSGPDMDQIRESVGIMHLRQLTQSMLTQIVSLIGDANFCDPTHAFGVAVEGLSSKDYPLLSFLPSDPSAISSATGGDHEAHTIVPLSTSDTPTESRIYVYDSNFPYSRHKNFYEGPTARNYLLIDKSSSTKDWKYPYNYVAHPDSYGWAGSSAGPWTFIVTNMSKGRYRDNHPLNASYLLGQIGTLIFAGDGHVSQISDQDGHKLYKWQAGQRKLERDPLRKTTSVISWPFFTGRAGPPGEVYFIHDMTGKSYQFEIDGKGRNYRCTVLLPGNTLDLAVGSAAPGLDTLKLSAIGSNRQSTSLGTQRDLSKVDMEVFRRLPGEAIGRSFKVSDLRVRKQAPVLWSLVDNLNALQMQCDKADLNYQLEISQTFDKKTVKLPKQMVNTPAGKSQILRPDDWQDLQKSKLEVETKELKKLR
jgi:hypothetical protein